MRGRDPRDTRMARPFVLAFIGLKKRKSVMRVQRGNVIIFFIFETRCGLTMLFCTAYLTKFFNFNDSSVLDISFSSVFDW